MAITVRLSQGAPFFFSPSFLPLHRDPVRPKALSSVSHVLFHPNKPVANRATWLLYAMVLFFCFPPRIFLSFLRSAYWYPQRSAQLALVACLLSCLAFGSIALPLDGPLPGQTFITPVWNESNVWDGSCLSGCTQTSPCSIADSTQFDAKCPPVPLVFLEGSYADRNISLWNHDSPSVAFSGVVSHLNLNISTEQSQFNIVNFGSNSTLNASSVLITPAQRYTVIKIAISFTTFVDTTFSVNPSVLARTNFSWIISQCQFISNSSEAAPVAVFDFAVDSSQDVSSPVSTSFALSNVTASLYLKDGSDRSPYFIRSQAVINWVNITDSTIDGASTFLALTDLGYANIINLANTQFTGLRTALVSVERFDSFSKESSPVAAQANTDASLGAHSITKSVARAIAEPKSLYVVLIIKQSQITGLPNKSASGPLPRFSPNAVNFYIQKSTIAGVTINCNKDRTAMPLSGVPSSVLVQDSTFDDCGVCFGRNSSNLEYSHFNYRNNNTEHVFTSFTDLPEGRLFVSTVTFNELTNSGVPRLFFLGNYSEFSAQSFTTNTLYIQANSKLAVSNLNFTGTIVMNNGSIITTRYVTTWTFNDPVYLKYGSDDNGSAMLQMTSQVRLDLSPSAHYLAHPGAVSFIYNDPRITMPYKYYEDCWERVHFIWPSSRGVPPSNDAWLVANFTLPNAPSRIPERNRLPQERKDPFRFDAILQPINLGQSLYRYYLTLYDATPYYKPHQTWPSTPFIAPTTVPSVAPVNAPVATPRGAGCATAAPKVLPTRANINWICDNGVWSASGDVQVPADSTLDFPVETGLVRIAGSITFGPRSEMVFHDVSTRLIVQECINDLRQVSFDLDFIPGNEAGVSLLTQSACDGSRKGLQATPVEIRVKGPSGCTKLTASTQLSDQKILFANIFVSKGKCNLINGVIGGVVALVVVAGAITGIILFRKFRTKSKAQHDSALEPLIQ